MIDKIEFINIFNPDSYNVVKTLPTFKKKIPDKVNINNSNKYIYKNYNSINLLDYYVRNKKTSRGIQVVAYSSVIVKIMVGIYMNKNFTIEVIKDRKIIYLNEPDDLNNNENLLYNLKRQYTFKNLLLNNNKNPRYGLSKIKLGNYTILVAGKIDANIFEKHINILLVKSLSYKILLESYINGIITKTYKILYGVVNKDDNIRYYNSLKVDELDNMLSLDIEKGKKFFNKIIKSINSNKKHKFNLNYNSIKKEIIME